MLTVKVQKSDLGGYIAMQEGDTPLRYIAAAGDTEAAAVAALFDYHADLIRKGRIDTKEVTKGIKAGSILPDIGQIDPSEHGIVITKNHWAYVLPIIQGVAKEARIGNVASLICNVVGQCIVSTGHVSKTLVLEANVIRWLRSALSVVSVRGGVLEKFESFYEQDGYYWSNVDKQAARAIHYSQFADKKYALWILEQEITSFIYSLISSIPTESERVELFPLGLANQYLRLMFNKECSSTIDMSDYR